MITQISKDFLRQSTNSKEIESQICSSYQYSSAEDLFLLEYQNYQFPSYQFEHIKNGKLVALCRFQIVKNYASYYGRPMKFFWCKDLPSEVKSFIFNDFLNELKELQCKELFILKSSLNSTDLDSQNITTSREKRALIDLNLDPQELTRGTRKSYRSLINWGRRELEINFFDYKNISPQIMEDFRKFHIFVSGRETRCRETWKLQLDFIKENKGFVTFATYKSQLVSAILTLIGNFEATYGVAVNDRNLMAEKLPIGHWPLMASILKSKDIGMERFDLGIIDSQEMSDKEAAIAKFKEGFSKFRPEIELLNIRL